MEGCQEGRIAAKRYTGARLINKAKSHPTLERVTLTPPHSNVNSLLFDHISQFLF